jgi:hypothetical protein
VETVSDEKLMALVQQDDPTALRKLFDRHHGSLYGFFFGRLGLADTAEQVELDRCG